MKKEREPRVRREEGIDESLGDRIKRLTADVGGRADLNSNGATMNQIKSMFPGINQPTIAKAIEGGFIHRSNSGSSIYHVPDVVTLMCLQGDLSGMQSRIKNKIPRLARNAYNEFRAEQEKAKNKGK